jgi:hypothetical protein
MSYGQTEESFSESFTAGSPDFDFQLQDGLFPSEPDSELFAESGSENLIASGFAQDSVARSSDFTVFSNGENTANSPEYSTIENASTHDLHGYSGANSGHQHAVEGTILSTDFEQGETDRRSEFNPNYNPNDPEEFAAIVRNIESLDPEFRERERKSEKNYRSVSHYQHNKSAATEASGIVPFKFIYCIKDGRVISVKDGGYKLASNTTDVNDVSGRTIIKCCQAVSGKSKKLHEHNQNNPNKGGKMPDSKMPDKYACNRFRKIEGFKDVDILVYDTVRLEQVSNMSLQSFGFLESHLLKSRFSCPFDQSPVKQVVKGKTRSAHLPQMSNGTASIDEENFRKRPFPFGELAVTNGTSGILVGHSLVAVKSSENEWTAAFVDTSAKLVEREKKRKEVVNESVRMEKELQYYHSAESWKQNQQPQQQLQQQQHHQQQQSAANLGAAVDTAVTAAAFTGGATATDAAAAAATGGCSGGVSIRSCGATGGSSAAADDIGGGSAAAATSSAAAAYPAAPQMKSMMAAPPVAASAAAQEVASTAAAPPAASAAASPNSESNPGKPRGKQRGIRGKRGGNRGGKCSIPACLKRPGFVKLVDVHREMYRSNISRPPSSPPSSQQSSPQSSPQSSQQSSLPRSFLPPTQPPGAAQPSTALATTASGAVLQNFASTNVAANVAAVQLALRYAAAPSPAFSGQVALPGGGGAPVVANNLLGSYGIPVALTADGLIGNSGLHMPPPVPPVFVHGPRPINEILQWIALHNLGFGGNIHQHNFLQGELVGIPGIYMQPPAWYLTRSLSRWACSVSFLNASEHVSAQERGVARDARAGAGACAPYYAASDYLE